MPAGTFPPFDDQRNGRKFLVSFASIRKRNRRSIESAIGALQRAYHESAKDVYAHGLAIPGDISIIGFDDVPLSRWLNPPLTTIRQPLQEMGRVATTMLLRLLAGEPLETTRVELASLLAIRESCAPRIAHDE